MNYLSRLDLREDPMDYFGRQTFEASGTLPTPSDQTEVLAAMQKADSTKLATDDTNKDKVIGSVKTFASKSCKEAEDE
jgi:hypothetical protein